MTRSLALCEVLHHIIRFTTYDSEDPYWTHHETACSIARTCKAFSPIAFDVIWKALPSLEPLLAVFPDDLVEKTETKNEHGRVRRHFALLRHPQLEDWSAYNKYAHSVCGISIDGDNLCEHALEVLDALGSFHPGSALLPHLRHLRWDGRNLAYAKLLVGPPFLDIKISPVSNCDNEAVLRSTNQPSPALDIVQDTRGGAQEANPAVLRTPLPASSCSNLSSFSSEAEITPEILLALGRLPALTELDLEIIHDVDFTSVKIPPNATFFPALASIKLRGRGFKSVPIQPLVEAMQTTQLASVTIATDEAPSLYSLKICFNSLSNYGTLDVISFLWAAHPEYGSPFTSTSDATLDILRPLFALKDLTILSLPSFHCTLDDDGLRQIAKIWPRIEDLTLATSPLCVSPITLDGLVEFVTLCPTLSSLTLGIDARRVPVAYKTRPGSGRISRTLQSLNLGSSLITDPAAVAAYLSVTLPFTQLSTFPSYLAMGEALTQAYYERWGQVSHLLSVFVAVRQQECQSQVEEGDLLNEEEYLAAHAHTTSRLQRIYAD